MIGLFDSGHGGLTVLRALAERFPGQRFVYLGDHANAPYGNRPSDEVVVIKVWPRIPPSPKADSVSTRDPSAPILVVAILS